MRLLTLPDPKTGRDHRLFDPLDWVHAVTTQIPDARQHMVRYYGAYANRARRLYRPPLAEPAAGKTASSGPRPDEDEQDLWVRARRRSWARLIARIYEVDLLVCPRCGHELKVVAAITDPVVIDSILEHRKHAGLRSPFEPGAPPAAFVRNAASRSTESRTGRAACLDLARNSRPVYPGTASSTS